MNATKTITPASITPSYGHIPGLEGMRALAVLIVIASHIGWNHIVPGGFGVTLFFFISGMLITRLLLAEYNATGGISIKLFYMRRMLRLYPALLLAILLGTIALWFKGGEITWQKLSAALFYYYNYYGIFSAPDPYYHGYEPFGILWSLAVEQQYYLLFPFFVLPFLRNNKQLLIALIALVIAILLWRSHLYYSGTISYDISVRTDTRIDSILYGAILTLILAQKHSTLWLGILTHRITIIVAVLVLLSTFIIRNDVFRDTVRYTLQGIALMPICATICFTNKLPLVSRILETTPLTYIGMWSYSMYLLQSVAIMIAEAFWPNGHLGVAHNGLTAYLGFFATVIPLWIGLSVLSYYCLEKPANKWRYLFSARASAQPSTTKAS